MDPQALHFWRLRFKRSLSMMSVGMLIFGPLIETGLFMPVQLF